MPTISAPEKIKQNRTQCIVEFSAEETQKAEEAAVQRLGSTVNIAGFRPGKAPIDQLRARLKPEAILDDMIRHLLPPTLASVVQEHNLKPIIPPSVEIESSAPLKVKVIYIEKPEVKLKGLDKMKIEKTEPKVDEKDIQRMVDYIMEQHRTISPVDRASQDGDQITMDFVGVDEHKNEIEGTRSSGYQVRIGSKTLIPGFEEQLIGLKKGEEKSFEITFPEKYHAEHLRGKPATFSVNVTNIESVHLPELTDEFAKQHLDAESKDAFKERIKDSMRQQEEQLDRQKREEKLLTALVDATIVDLPEELKEQEKRAMFRELAEQLQQQGLTPEAWMEQTKRTPEQVEKELTEQSERRLKLRFGMEQALEDKQIEVTDDEVQAMIDDMMSRTPAEARAQEAARFSPGHQGYEEMKWRRRVDKFIEEMLK